MNNCATKLEKYFSDKIDWKFFNYLKDKLTTYEDSGNNVIILIGLPNSSPTSYIYQYGYAEEENGNFGYADDYYYPRNVIDDYEINEFPLSYYISIDFSAGYRFDIYEKISSKCLSVSFDDIWVKAIPK